MNNSFYAADPMDTFGSHSEFYQNSSYADFSQEHRYGGSFGVSAIKCEQEPIDFIDAPVPELVFCRVDTVVRQAIVDSGDGAKFSSSVGKELVVYPAETATRSFVSDPHSITMFCLPVSSISAEMEAAGIEKDGAAFAPWLSHLKPLPSSPSFLMDRIWEILKSNNPIDSLLLDGLTLQFLSLLAGAPTLLPLADDRNEDFRVARAIEYIEAHLGEQLNVAELSGVAALSAGHFSRAFKSTTGEAVWAYVQRRRCERARERLIATNDPIAKIAFDCGFSSQAHMTRQISARFGASPAVIRREAAL
jgi:AraC-like DNA-binding protein